MSSTWHASDWVKTSLAVMPVGTVDLGAVNLALSPNDMARGLALAGWPTSDADRPRFHRPYIVDVNGPTIASATVTQLKVITECLRQLIAEEHARVSDTYGGTGVQDADVALRPRRGPSLDRGPAQVQSWPDLTPLRGAADWDYCRSGGSAVAQDLRRTAN